MNPNLHKFKKRYPPEERKRLRKRIKELMVEKISENAMAKVLNSEGWRTPSGSDLSQADISRHKKAILRASEGKPAGPVKTVYTKKPTPKKAPSSILDKVKTILDLEDTIGTEATIMALRASLL